MVELVVVVVKEEKVDGDGVEEEVKVNVKVELEKDLEILNLHKSHHHHHCCCCCSELDTVPYPVGKYYLQLPPIYAAYESSLCVHSISDVPLLPHPVEAVAELAVHSSKYYAFVASIFHHVLELHP